MASAPLNWLLKIGGDTLTTVAQTLSGAINEVKGLFSSINNIEDVTISNPDDGQFLGYDSTNSEWKNIDVPIPSIVSKQANGLAPQLPDETSVTKFLRQDGTWNEVPYNTFDAANSGIITNANNPRVAYVKNQAYIETVENTTPNTQHHFSQKLHQNIIDDTGWATSTVVNICTYVEKTVTVSNASETVVDLYDADITPSSIIEIYAGRATEYPGDENNEFPHSDINTRAGRCTIKFPPFNFVNGTATIKVRAYIK